MKLPKSVQVKDATKLFLNKYKHKLVLVTPFAHVLRNKDIDTAKSKVEDSYYYSRINSSVAQLKYFYKVCNVLKKYKEEYNVRIENPRVSIYTDNTNLINQLVKIDENNVKFVVVPNNENPELTQGSVLVKRLNYDFKVHVAATRTNHNNFVEWSKNNPKIRMTRRCSVDLSRDRSWGGSYFYVKDEKTLTMVKMFLGSDISRVESVIKA
jgi:histidyl-tRNA synthetase